MDILLDISRTVARARHAQPTGIDRVERAYIDWALARGGRFLCRLRSGLFEVPARAVRRLLDWLDGRGEAPRPDLRARLSLRAPLRLRRAHALVRREGRRLDGQGPAPDGPGVYLNVGHDNLDPAAVSALGHLGWRRVVLLHDTIPLDHPDYTAPGIPERFRAKLQGMARAEAIVCNSHFTADRLAIYLPDGTGRVEVLPLGIGPVAPTTPRSRAFVVLGTIEPRKNHTMLLNLWARHWPREGPHLHVIGRRGWRNSAVFEVLDTHPVMGRTVHERGTLDDEALESALAGATALLFPSFAEGYGLPLAEALARGVPAIASDLPALREVGGDVPEWLAPNDPQAWVAAIEAYADPASLARAAQLARLSGWQPPTWDAHFSGLENLLETILVQSPKGR